MSFDNPAREKILGFLRAYEQIGSENHAMKIMLETVQWPDGRRGIPGWQKMLGSILANPECQTATHEAFESLRAEIESAIDETAMQSVLLKVPTKVGLPN